MYRLQLKEIQEYAEEKLLFEEMSAASDIMFATSSDTVGREFSQKWSGEFSTKECGEPSHVILAVSWRARLSQMFAQPFHVRWRLVFFLSGYRSFLCSFAFGVFPLKLSFVFSCIWHVLTCHAVIFLVCAFIFCMSHGTARDPLKEMQQKKSVTGAEWRRDAPQKKGDCLFLAGGLLRSVSRCTLGERVCCLLLVSHCVVLLFLSHRDGQTETLGRVRPASPRNATRKWIGRVESDVLHLQTLQSGDMEPTVHTSAPHAQCTRGKIACDRRLPLSPEGSP